MDFNIIPFIYAQKCFMDEYLRRSNLIMEMVHNAREISDLILMHYKTLLRTITKVKNEQILHNLMYCKGMLERRMDDLHSIIKNLYVDMVIQDSDNIIIDLEKLDKLAYEIYDYNIRTLKLYPFDFRDEAHNNLYEIRKTFKMLKEEVYDFGY